MYKCDTDMKQCMYPTAHTDGCEANVTPVTR